ncbi:hypothetical protein [Halobacterium sp. KA-6]|uniref:hypothetical protein n=1 Tax=Halobacterium sp. KA-6 TaxID=2896368 RepID=UPI001E52E2CD|nr:hypothetical protein [Halobacterium sp. KA-6]MCD2204083.1 hypothetical protein [Halobacterium sp. KA-6]
MTDERATVRPVTLGRLVELTYLCEEENIPTEEIEQALDVSHRRARETIIEAKRISLLQEDDPDDDLLYSTTSIGESFLEAVRAEDWPQVSNILATRSPHYGTFLDALEEVEPADLETVLDGLKENQQFTPYSYNQTSIEVLGDWAERLGQVQRNAFTGSYYLSSQTDVSSNFAYVLLSAYDDLEQTAGVNLRQRYLSIPRLREEICERTRCSRSAFDRALVALCQQNVGKLELSGAPMDTAAKDSALGIKRIELAGGGELVSTSQSSQQVMVGVESFDKQYYYLAVHDRDVTFDQEDT